MVTQEMSVVNHHRDKNISGDVSPPPKKKKKQRLHDRKAELFKELRLDLGSRGS